MEVSDTSRHISSSDLKVLWGRAAGRCAFPGCRTECAVDATHADPARPVGKIAHIVAHSDSGPRADSAYPAHLRGRYDNLILLCPTHHDIVDVQPHTYTVADLRNWKLTHEEWVRQSLMREMPQVGFAELEIATKAILSSSTSSPNSDLTVTDPTKKMKRNQLTDAVRYDLSLGMVKAREVEEFVDRMAALDADFPERIRAGFVEQYERHREEGLTGDALFAAMRDFATGARRDFRRQAAGLAVLVYLFEKCEVFEQ